MVGFNKCTLLIIMETNMTTRKTKEDALIMSQKVCPER